MFATSCAQIKGNAVSEAAVIGARRVQIKRYIEANLRNPELSVRSVAAAFGISPRYLHIMFSRDVETVSDYVLRRRLEECGRQLADALWRQRTITEIAFGWGFNNATHFGARLPQPLRHQSARITATAASSSPPRARATCRRRRGWSRPDRRTP